MDFPYGVVVPIRTAFEKIYEVDKEKDETFLQFMNKCANRYTHIVHTTSTFDECIQTIFNFDSPFGRRSFNTNLAIEHRRLSVFAFRGLKYVFVGNYLHPTHPDLFQRFPGYIRLEATEKTDMMLKSYDLHHYETGIWHGNDREVNESEVFRLRLI